MRSRYFEFLEAYQIQKKQQQQLGEKEMNLLWARVFIAPLLFYPFQIYFVFFFFFVVIMTKQKIKDFKEQLSKRSESGSISQELTWRQNPLSSLGNL